MDDAGISGINNCYQCLRVPTLNSPRCRFDREIDALLVLGLRG